MKAFLVLLGSLVLVLLVFLSGVVITAKVIAEPEPHKFANVNTPDLWTSEPKKIDVETQTYERIAAAPVPANTTGSSSSRGQTSSTGSDGVDQTATASIAPAEARPDPALTSPSAADPQHAQWCQARYRSYRAEDNSYQPFGGGPRQQCKAPGSPAVATASAESSYEIRAGAAGYQGSTEDLEQANRDNLVMDERQPYRENVRFEGSSDMNAGVQGGSHEQWCAARYRSYRIEDNTYQPFDGSMRRACRSPFG